MGKRELVALLNLSSWCLVIVEQLFLAVPRGCLRFVVVVFPDHTQLLFLSKLVEKRGSKLLAFDYLPLECNKSDHIVGLVTSHSLIKCA